MRTFSAHGLVPKGFVDQWLPRAASQMGGGRMDAKTGAFAPRYDAAESAFTQRALTHIATEIFPTLIPPLEARKFIPTGIEGNPGDETYLWRKPTRTGIARLFAPGAALDLPVVGAFIEEVSTRYYAVGAQLEYSYFELLAIGAALANGQPFDFVKEKLIAALEANEKKLDLIAAFGTATPPNSYGHEIEADVGLTGLLNNASISTYVTPAGASGSKTWALKTADEVLLDLYGAVSYQRSTTYKVHAPNTMIMPIAQKQALISRRMSDVSGESILSYFMRTQREAGQPIEVFDWMYMQGSGLASSDQFIVFNRDVRMLKHVLAMDVAPLPPTTNGLVTTQQVVSKTAGCVVYRPLSITSGSYI